MRYDYAAVAKLVNIARDLGEGWSVCNHFVGNTRQFNDNVGNFALGIDHCGKFFYNLAVYKPDRADLGNAVVGRRSTRRFKVKNDDIRAFETLGNLQVHIEQAGLANFFDRRRFGNKICFGRTARLLFLIDKILGQFAKIHCFYRKTMIAGVGNLSLSEHDYLTAFLHFFEFFKRLLVIGKQRAGHSARAVVKIIYEKRLARFGGALADAHDLARDIQLARAVGCVLYVHNLVGFVVAEKTSNRIHFEISGRNKLYSGIVNLFFG